MAKLADTPDLSLVVTSRNDNHGGDLLQRMQIFVTGWLEQARRHHVNSELIIVEWNPPADRPTLAEALTWPRDPGPCTVRVIQVPPEVHHRYRHADKMPLFQYIAKNVGIRRARGRFVLATNIDLLFSDGLARFLASLRLNPQYMYRIDRHDVPADVPLHAPVTQQLQYCRDRVLRVNTREGTYTPDELRSAFRRFPHRNRLLRNLAKLRPLLPYRPRSLRSLTDPEALRRFIAARVELLATALRFVGRLTRRSLRAWRDPAALRRFVTGRLDVIDAWRHALGRGWTSMRRMFGRTVRTREGWLLQFRGIRPLHTNACGDFTLLARQRWFGLRAYPELEIFSIHLDSVLCNMAHYAGVREVVLRGSDLRLYHVEHASGWSPEEMPRLIQRLNERGIPWIDMPEFDDWVACMRATHQPFIFNDANWGLAGEEFEEAIIGYGEAAAPRVHRAAG